MPHSLVTYERDIAMQKKFLRTFAISVIFIGVFGPIGIKNAYGMYTETLEDEITKNKCKQLLCNPTPIGRAPTQYGTTYGETKVGEARVYHMGSFQTVDVTAYRPVGRYSFGGEILGYECSRCKRNLWRREKLNAPTVRVTRRGGQKVITLIDDEWNREKEMCKNPDLCGELKEIWDSRGRSGEMWFSAGLRSLWIAARELDKKPQNDGGDFTERLEENQPLSEPEYVFETKSCCSCCTII